MAVLTAGIVVLSTVRVNRMGFPVEINTTLKLKPDQGLDEKRLESRKFISLLSQGSGFIL
jgi:hypothetical protein